MAVTAYSCIRVPRKLTTQRAPRAATRHIATSKMRALGERSAKLRSVECPRASSVTKLTSTTQGGGLAPKLVQPPSSGACALSTITSPGRALEADRAASSRSGARGEKRPSAYRRPEPQSAEPRLRRERRGVWC